MQVRKAILIVAGILLSFAMWAEDADPLPIGSPAPDFSLKGIDGQVYSLESFKDARVLTLVFTANHCPTAQAYQERMKALSAAYDPSDMVLVGISSNHPEAVCLEELGYTDLGDSYEEMILRARDAAFNFPYLFDGEEQALAIACGAKATPHVYIFDEQRKLRYRGQIDEMESPYEEATRHDARNAIDALLEGKPVPVETTRAFGCSMKWKSKLEWRRTLDERWNEREVSMEEIGSEDLKALLENPGTKYRLLNVWATWCGPCVIEFPELVNMQRMYGKRNFEVVSMSMDRPPRKEAALDFLREEHAAFPNYIWSGGDREEMVELIDPGWEGNIPYTMLIAPGGKVVYRHDGIIDPLEVKKMIVGKLGRYFADD